MTRADDTLSLEAGRPPARRLVLALAIAPLLLGLVMTLFVFLMAGLSDRPTGEAEAEAGRSAVKIFAYLLGFTATLGATAAVALRVLDLRGPLPWTLAGAAAGLVAAAIYGAIEGVPLGRGILVTCAMLGWGQFLVMRWIAGLR